MVFYNIEENVADGHPGFPPKPLEEGIITLDTVRWFIAFVCLVYDKDHLAGVLADIMVLFLLQDNPCFLVKV